MGIFGRSPLLDFHKPQTLGLKHPLKPESLACLRTLSEYQRPKPYGRFPRSRSAAVLVALFIGREGDLYVLLNQRSSKLRSYPGDTSLPGGKIERRDRSLENAARREAFEEIGLPLDKTKVPLLCILEPFVSSSHVIVTPVVVLILDSTLRPILNRSEVQSLFSHPLLGFLTTSWVREPESRSRATGAITGASPAPGRRSTSNTHALKQPAKPYHSFQDIEWHGHKVRMHDFLTGREDDGIKPISGITSAILIRTAQIGYARSPEFELEAEGHLNLQDRVAIGILRNKTLWQACQAEGIEKDWLDHSLASPPGHKKDHSRL